MHADVCVIVLCAFMTATLGCDHNHSVAGSEFNQSCTTAADCDPVYLGPISCCGLESICPNGAINAMDSTKYMQVVNTRIPTCSPAPPCIHATCSRSDAICVNSMCQFRPPSDAGSD
jgi:hypothetical protein